MLLAFIALSAAQSSAQTHLHSAILVIDNSNNPSYNQVHWLIGTPYLSIKANDEENLYEIIKNRVVDKGICSISHLTGKCFPSITNIKLRNGKIVMMSDLQKGDRVQTGNITENTYNITEILIY